MSTLVMMKGLPGSGKSTFARKLVDEGYTRVNKDDLRAMLHNSKWTKHNEKVIIAARNYLVSESLYAGRNVVVDDTNFEPKHEEELRKIAKKYGCDFKVEFIDTPLDECIKRDLNRPVSVGEKVIRRMYNKYLRNIETPKPAETPCVIFDIDGTLAHMNGRSPFEWGKVGEDAPDDTVVAMNQIIDVMRTAVSSDLKIIIMSGRDSVCRPETELWLKENEIFYDELYMRAAGDNRPDTIIKAELYEEHINGKYNVNVVFDDRDQVVEMWRNKGLKVFQVAEGDF